MLWAEDGSMKHLAIDIGASSGKLVRSELREGKLLSETIFRFPTRQKRENGHLVWDIDWIYGQLLQGIEAAGPVDLISIDTWAVDYVLVDRNGERLTPAVAYRDARTRGMECSIAQSELYRRTGIQFQEFNTIYQLLALQKEDPDALQNAYAMLMIPDYLAYRLTGRMAQEYTNATTTGLVKAGTAEWDMELIRALGLPERIFLPISMSGTMLGPLKTGKAGFILAPTHDTASAVLACPLSPSSLFLSSGTWSLLGTISPDPVTSTTAMEANLTNEGADDGKIRLLKNIMGTWMLQCLRKECKDASDFGMLSALAEKSACPGLVDPLDSRFLAPESMMEEIASALAENGDRRPSDTGEYAAVIYRSLAEAYRRAADEISMVTGKEYDHIAIAGGGSQDGYLARLTKERTGMRVTAGPVEASAAGNAISAMLHTGELDRSDISTVLMDSFGIEEI